jgi:citrate lyase subunit beta/citryl-CoA lyase
MHPLKVLFRDEIEPTVLPVCDHYAGSEKFMRKSLELQAQLGPVFDITFDCEDGAVVGAEREHAELIASLLNSPENRFGRVGVRVHDRSHLAFWSDLDIILSRAGANVAYVTIPKVTSLADAEGAVAGVRAAEQRAKLKRRIPIHMLVETHGAVRDVFDIAALPEVQCLSFGLMDFVSSHYGAIPSDALTVPRQFTHPLVRRAKLQIAAACHAVGKVASHNVVTELDSMETLIGAAKIAARDFGYTRMWSIHPSQIRPIVAIFTPRDKEIELAIRVLTQAQDAGWGPIRFDNKLHDRASYRYFWNVLRRAQAVGLQLPAEALPFLADQ